MKNMLVTGGTVFVSRYLAEYYTAKGWNVYVLNRNNREQSKDVTLIQADRHAIGDALRKLHFDVVMDTAYTGEDVVRLLEALDSYDDYILISSSAVYSETAVKPFQEDSVLGVNRYWGQYGRDKIEAEEALVKRKPDAYILRPPYLYGPMNNVYREAFVFDCALAGRKFYLPGDGEMKLQFFHIQDLCRFTEILLKEKPGRHIFNVGNKETVSVKEWVELCFDAAGRQPDFVKVGRDIEQRNYFCFYPYEYALDVTAQDKLLKETIPLSEGLKESFAWYRENGEKVNKRDYFNYIDKYI